MRALALLILIPVLTNAQGAGKQPTRVKLIRSPKAVALAKAFHTGKLPDPLRMPAGTIDQQATALAKAVATGDDSSTPALYAAVLASGYGVRDTDKSVMQTTENGQGLVLASGKLPRPRNFTAKTTALRSRISRTHLHKQCQHSRTFQLQMRFSTAFAKRQRATTLPCVFGRSSSSR
jgi:hypothetical protein